ADRVIVVVDEAKERLVSIGANPERIRVFGNTEPLRLVPDTPLPLDLANGPRIVYVGGVAPHRGLDTVLAAMPAVLATDSRARLTIVGDGESLGTLRAQTTALHLDAAVTFTGRLPKDEAMDHIRDANIALVPHHRSPHTDSTIPHKLFQYMALGRPVLVSDCAPLARIVRETGSGLVFRAGDAADLASRIGEIAAPEAAAVMAGAGRAAVLEHWNLEAEAPNLAGLYKELAKGAG
ncbi:MAG: glycosyltransferase, partial [Coriobacteriia bacterium]|nr:glycosyltransferase [Coriobacteriia bacterium]